jgi:hypothetical protein
MPAFIDIPPNHAPVVITEDGGGLVQKYIDTAIRYAFEKRQVAITGSCRSACMMALAVPNVCVTKNAEVSFHWAYDQTTNVLRKDVTNYMMTLLPDNIQASMKGKLKRDFSSEATLSGEKLIKLGINECQFTK